MLQKAKKWFCWRGVSRQGESASVDSVKVTIGKNHYLGKGVEKLLEYKLGMKLLF